MDRVISLQLVVASFTIQYWQTENNPAATVNPAAWVSLFYVAIVAINSIGVKGYGEAEFIMSLLKVLAVIGFIILALS